MQDNEIQQLDIVVQGLVQGVFFRASTKEKAQALGITGNVRNTPDGAVRIQAEGSSHALQQFMDWLWQGPPQARVETVDAAPVTPQGFRDFVILR